MLTYTVSGGGLSEANVKQVKPCFNMMLKSNDSPSIIWLILNLSLNLIVTDFGKFILFPFKVTLTSFQSISVISQI